MPFLRSPARRLLAAAALVVLGSGAQAQDAHTPAAALRWSGFGSVGVTHVDAPDGWGLRRELSQTASDADWRADLDSRLGVQLNYAIGSRFELVAQLIAKKRGHHAEGADALEWAYASYRLTPEWTLRAGRVNVDAFLMADYRNVGYGFLAARPSVELYGRLPTTLDGADIARSWIDGDAQWRVKLMTGSASVGDVDLQPAARVNRVLGGMVSREAGGLLLRASVARATIDIDLANAGPALAGLDQLAQLPVPAVADEALRLRRQLGATGVRATFLELGLRHELADWQWSAELIRIDGKSLTVETMANITVGRRVGDWTPFASYGIARARQQPAAVPAWQATLTPLIGPAAAAQAQMLGGIAATALNTARVDQSTWSLGVRWDFHPQAAAKLQWDRIRVQPAGSALWSRADGTPANATAATAVVDFIF